MAKNDKPKNDATPMDPAVEARRSGPPAGADSVNDDMPVTPHYVGEAEGDHNSETIQLIEAMLKDPTFDTSGVYREKLALLTRRLPGKRYPATTDTDERGDPEGQEPQR